MTLGNATKVCDGYVRRGGIYQSNDNKSFRRLIVIILIKIIYVVDRDIVKSMTDMCDGGAYIKRVVEV